MRRCAGLLCVLAVGAAPVASAAAQDGAGLYEPFPSPAGPEVARDFIGELPAPGRRLAANLSSDELERGVRVPSAGVSLPAASGDVAERANPPGGGAGSAAGWLGVAAVVALAAVGARRLTHR
jgi:hypothetical protein